MILASSVSITLRSILVNDPEEDIVSIDSDSGKSEDSVGKLMLFD
jgi:hypothetical protein